MKTVYYSPDRLPGDNRPAVLVTSKDHWDRYHAIDDGGGPDYGAIDAAMLQCGCDPLMESAYGIAGVPIEALTAGMMARGFLLVRDPAFDAWCRRTS